MREFETCNNNETVIFNNLFRAVRNPIESAFGSLKARWSILTRNMDLKIESIHIVVYPCFILHTFCGKKNYFPDEALVTAQIYLAKRNQEE